MQSIFYHNSSGNQAFTGNLKRKEVHRAITLHPIKSSPYMYRLHNYMRGLKIQDLQQEKIKLQRDIYSMGKELNINLDQLKNYQMASDLPLFPVNPYSEDYPGDTEILGVPIGLRTYKPTISNEVIPWDFISKSEYSLTDFNPRRRIHSDIKEALDDNIREVMVKINACSRQRGRVVDERSALYGYRRINSYGADTILDLLLVYRKFRGKKLTMPVRRHIYLHQHFTGLEIREIINEEEFKEDNRESDKRFLKHLLPSRLLDFNFNSNRNNVVGIEEKSWINFILPLSGRYEIFQRFLQNYEEVCLKKTNERTKLLIILYKHKIEDTLNKTMNLIEQLKYKYRDAQIEVILGSGEEFSRANALHEAVNKMNDNDLLFFIDVDIIFTNLALNRIRLNTLINKQIYFPVVFSEYDPKIVYDDNLQMKHDKYVINEISGYWRQFGFGIVSLYKIDYNTVGGFDLSIRGWGKEDVLFYDKVVKSKIKIFRAADINLIHVYHDVECGKELSDTQLSMCMGTKADTYASPDTLAKIIYNNPKYLKFAKERRFQLTKAGS
ncbi:hypothetical protein M0802_014776 [Mischocyttarus mexicanus]|nr:hypothetical protein M0802_014776 [Mischocyttarus mexicanus]